jgi:hypothetical protein
VTQPWPLITGSPRCAGSLSGGGVSTLAGARVEATARAGELGLLV